MYFDPGTGSMIIQMLLGSIPVVAAFFIALRKKLLRKADDKGVNEIAGQTADTAGKANDNFEDIDDD